MLNGAFAITGELAAGQVVTVRYTVVVNAEGERGNDVAANFLVPSGEEPPAVCDPDSRLCTEHPTVTPTPEPTPEPTPTDPAPEPTGVSIAVSALLAALVAAAGGAALMAVRRRRERDAA